MNTQLRLSFEIPEAQAEWVGSALFHLFPDGVVVQSGTRPQWSRVSAWLPLRSKLKTPRIQAELKSIGAVRIKALRQTPKVWVGPKAKPFPLVQLGRFVAVPAARSGMRLPKHRIPIYLLQAQAFGTGLHESTRLMIAGLESFARLGRLSQAQLLDVGAGSGILGFAALHLGAARVTCAEIESAACAELRENRRLNGVPAAKMPVLAGRYPLMKLRGKRYPLILGNLVTPVLELLMPALKRQLAPGGTLMCSGIHTLAEERRVTKAAKAQGLKVSRSARLRAWARLEFVRP